MQIKEAIKFVDEINISNSPDELVKNDAVEILGILHLLKGALDALDMRCFRIEEAEGVVVGCEMQAWKAIKLVDKII